MRVLPVALCACVSLFSLPSFAAMHTLHSHRHTSTHAVVRHASASTRSRRAEHSSFEHPVASISPERATEIQTALISHGYLAGQPTGTWDAASISAMEKIQSDNGWQTKLVPDSRALIKLGLGPGSTPEPVAPGNTIASSAELGSQ